MTMFLRFSLVTVLLSSPLFAARSHDVISASGDVFVKTCSGLEKPESRKTGMDVHHDVVCMSYVAGIVQGADAEVTFAYTSTNKKPPVPFCFSDDVKWDEMVRVVLKYIHAHPAESRELTSGLVFAAFRETYPCK